MNSMDNIKLLTSSDLSDLKIGNKFKLCGESLDNYIFEIADIEVYKTNIFNIGEDRCLKQYVITFVETVNKILKKKIVMLNKNIKVERVEKTQEYCDNYNKEYNKVVRYPYYEIYKRNLTEPVIACLYDYDEPLYVGQPRPGYRILLI